MRSALTLVTAPAAEPVTLAEAKAFARLDGSDEDAFLAALITSATLAAEQYLRRSLITQTWALSLDLAGSSFANGLPEGVYDLPVTALYSELPTSFALPRGPVQAVSSVVTYDTSNASSTYSSSNYFVDANGDRLVLNQTATWPSNLRCRAACVITYTAGYGDTGSSVPQPIRTAILMHIAQLYEQRGQCDDPTMSMPPAAQHLLNQYRIYGERRG